jgi:hypothetical protein
VPDTENFIPFRISINRAAQLVFVPQSTEIIALSSSSSETASAITCGLIGLSQVSYDVPLFTNFI